MTQWNEVAAQLSTLWKRSYEQGTEFSTRVGEEATRVVEGQIDQARKVMELGMETQTELYNEWMKQTATARDMWSETVHSFGKTFEAPKATKAKAS